MQCLPKRLITFSILHCLLSRFVDGPHAELVGKPEKKRPLEKSSRRFECTINTGRKEIRCEVVESIELPRYRIHRLAVANLIMNLRVL